jgi:PAS domain S-box-containing protein
MLVTFRTKLVAIVVAAAFAQLLLIFASTAIANRVERQLDDVQRRYLPKIDLQPRLEATLERLWRGFEDAVAAHDPEALAATRQVHESFLSQLEGARGALDPAAASKLKDAFEDYDHAAYDVTRRLIADETGEAMVGAIAGMQARQTRVQQVLGEATAFDRRALSQAFSEATRAEGAAKSYRLSISVGCLIVVFCLSAWLGRDVLRSLDDLASGLRRFGTGDFSQPVRFAGHDELADVARQANHMAASLERLGREHRRAEAKFRALLESAPDATVIVGTDGRIALINAQTEKLFGYRRDDLVGEDAGILVPAKHHDEANSNAGGFFRDADAKANGSAVESYGRRRDGAEFPIEISLSPIETEEGTLVSSAIRDITQRKQIETALKLSNRELEAFSYSVAHDLRAPLRAINGYAMSLVEDLADKLDGDSKMYLERIGASAERMGQLIDALLSLARVSRTNMKREAVDLAYLARSTVAQLRAGDPARVVEFVVTGEARASGDAQLVRALLENLLGNAWKFTSKQAAARIEFGCEKADSRAPVFFVRDNGAGFDMAYAEKLFAPFQRLHTTDEFPGTGIGLATVHRIVERHGGRIWAEGASGAGAVFRFTLAEAKEAQR